jgi:hypothetical protein
VLAHFKLYADEKYDSVAVDALCAVVEEGIGRRQPDPEAYVRSEAMADGYEVSSLGLQGNAP